MGNFVTEMNSDFYQLLGTAERGMLPEFFAKRSRYGTPLVGVLFFAFGVVLLSWMSFQEIIAAENYLYGFGMILEFIAFIKLRVTHMNISRPYRISLGTGTVLMIVPPSILIVVVMVLVSLKVMAVLFGFALQPCLVYVDKKRWLRFFVSEHLPDLQDVVAEDESTPLVV